MVNNAIKISIHSPMIMELEGKSRFFIYLGSSIYKNWYMIRHRGQKMENFCMRMQSSPTTALSSLARIGAFPCCFLAVFVFIIRIIICLRYKKNYFNINNSNIQSFFFLPGISFAHIFFLFIEPLIIISISWNLIFR